MISATSQLEFIAIFALRDWGSLRFESLMLPKRITN